MDAEKGLLNAEKDCEKDPMNAPPPYSELSETAYKQKEVCVLKESISARRFFCYQISAEIFLALMWIVLAPLMIWFDPTHDFLQINRTLYTLYMIPLDMIGTASLITLFYGLRKGNARCILPTIFFQIMTIFVYFYMLTMATYTFFIGDSSLSEFLVRDFLQDSSTTCIIGSDRFVQKTSGMLICISIGMILYLVGVVFLYVRLYFYYVLLETARRENRVLRPTCAFFLIHSPLIFLLGISKAAKTAPAEKKDTPLVVVK